MRLNEREIHGGTVAAGKASNPVILCERDDEILIRKEYHSFAVSAASARVMARNLQRLARRIEARAAASAIEARSDATGTGAAEGESAVGNAETPE